MQETSPVRRRPPFSIVGLWLVLGGVLAALTAHVRDWFVMTDELYYERLALAVDRFHSPLPRIHGVLVPNVNQIYPLVLAPVFSHGAIGTDLQAAHILNAFLMSSAALPTYLLARRLSASRWPAYVAAALTVVVPWIVLSSFLLTEVVAYPVLVWAALAFQRATSTPSARGDLLALGSLALAIFTRTQFAILALVLPVAVLAHECAFAIGRNPRERLVQGARSSVRAHPLLGMAYALGVTGALGAALSGRAASLLGTYAVTARHNPLPSGVWAQSAQVLALVGLGLGIAPFLVGCGWLVSEMFRPSSREQHAFAVVAIPTIVLMTLEVGSFNVRFGHSFVQERYLFYIAPLVLVGFVAALADGRLPRIALAAPTIVLVWGFHDWSVETFAKLNVDTPVSILGNYLVGAFDGAGGVRWFLVAVTVVAVAAIIELPLVAGRRGAAALLVGIALIALPAQTAYAFVRLFGSDSTGRSLTTTERPLSVDQSATFGWVDDFGGATRGVTIVPYPTNVGDYYASVGFWWDLEFWNRSVVRTAEVNHRFEWTPSSFPKVHLRFDRRTGAANRSLPGYIAQAIGDTRFQLAGSVALNGRGILLIQPEQPWRATWRSAGLYDDGWTRPGAPARVRVFGYPGQEAPVLRLVRISLQAPPGVRSRSYRLTTDAGAWSGKASSEQAFEQDVMVCVPRTGFADVRLAVTGRSTIFGDQNALDTFLYYRSVGLFVSRIELSGATYGAC